MSINFNHLFTHQTNQCTSQEANVFEDQIADLVNSVGNATIAGAASFQSSSAEPLSKEIVCKLYEQNQYEEKHQQLCIKALGKDSYLSEKGSRTIDLKTFLPEELKEKYKEYTTILDLLGYKFPLLTRSLLKRETEIPKFVVSLGYRDEPSLQIQAKQEIVFISSGSWTVKNLKNIHTILD